MEEDRYKSKYNKEPVHFCKSCGSLSILVMSPKNTCIDCGNTDLGTCLIQEWEETYLEHHGKYYINKPS